MCRRCRQTLKRDFIFLSASDLPKCRAGDTECLKQVITQTLTLVTKGRRDLNLPPVEPLLVNKLDINQGQSNSPVAINLAFRDLKVHGLSSAVITKVM